MINFTQIRDDIITQFNLFMSPVIAIMVDQNKPTPPYPFIGYKFTSPYIEQPGFAIETYADDNSPQTTMYTRIEQPTMTLSVTAYSETIDEAEMQALKALSWFKYIGYEYLKSKNLIVVDTTPLQDRDTLIVVDYERRQGFDVTIRTVSQIQRTIESIETFVIQQG